MQGSYGSGPNGMNLTAAPTVASRRSLDIYTAFLAVLFLGILIFTALKVPESMKKADLNSFQHVIRQTSFFEVLIIVR